MRALIRVCAAVFVLLLTTFGQSPARAGTVTCTAETGYSDCVRYTYSGANQTFVVPAGVTSIRVKLWGGRRRRRRYGVLVGNKRRRRRRVR